MLKIKKLIYIEKIKSKNKKIVFYNISLVSKIIIIKILFIIMISNKMITNK